VMLVEMTGGRDFVKLLDFGLARIISLDEPTITMPNMVAGKWTDRVVGRDLLFGTLFGIVYAILIALYEYANLRLGAPIFGQFGLAHLNGFRVFAGTRSVSR